MCHVFIDAYIYIYLHLRHYCRLGHMTAAYDWNRTSIGLKHDGFLQCVRFHLLRHIGNVCISVQQIIINDFFYPLITSRFNRLKPSAQYPLILTFEQYHKRTFSLYLTLILFNVYKVSVNLLVIYVLLQFFLPKWCLSKGSHR